MPLINELFTEYVDDLTNKDYLKPTTHFYNTINAKLKRKNSELEIQYNMYYELGEFPCGEYKIIIIYNKTNFQLYIIGSIVNFGKESGINNTNISFSDARTHKMYIYGIKTNGIGAKISGNILNKYAFEICKSMYIPKLYISDSAGIKCHWDEKIELNHFSILRVIVGNPTFLRIITMIFF